MTEQSPPTESPPEPSAPEAGAAEDGADVERAGGAAGDVTVRFSRDQALVLSDWLYHRLGTPEFDGLVDSTDRAAWSPIYAINGTLEHALTEIFRPDYSERLDAARERLLDTLGTIGRPETEAADTNEHPESGPRIEIC